MKILILVLLIIVLIPLLAYAFLWLFLVIRPKFKVDKSLLNLEREKIGDNIFRIGDSWLKKNEYGHWELFLTKSGFEGGLINGKLCKEQIDKQETYFVDEIKRIVPSNLSTFFLKIVIGWINRKIEQYIPEEYLLEIYGISLSASTKYNYITVNYQRYLNYHAANDIGHSIEDMNMVACTAFAVWNRKSANGALLVGRNFDFYFGEDFAQEKIICFFKPTKGHNFMMVSWAGMIGAVSGMNVHGLTLTINTAKSAMPTTARTPLCMIGREILQYAATISEAFEIAKKRETFISASFMISSGKENRAVIIEKSVSRTVLLENTNDNYISCTNHFQSPDFSDDALNTDNIKNGYSIHRLNRTNELINSHDKIGVGDIAKILRNQKGIGNADLGIANEKAINQLAAHHSIIFSPSELKVWVSTKKYQLGEMVCYDLNKVFTTGYKIENNPEIFTRELTIPADDFLFSGNVEKLVQYRKLENIIEAVSKKKMKANINDADIDSFIALNPSLFKSYVTAGNFYFYKKEYKKAKNYFEMALTREVASEKEKNYIRTRLAKSENKI